MHKPISWLAVACLSLCAGCSNEYEPAEFEWKSSLTLADLPEGDLNGILDGSVDVDAFIGYCDPEGADQVWLRFPIYVHELGEDGSEPEASVEEKEPGPDATVEELLAWWRQQPHLAILLNVSMEQFFEEAYSYAGGGEAGFYGPSTLVASAKFYLPENGVLVEHNADFVIAIMTEPAEDGESAEISLALCFNDARRSWAAGESTVVDLYSEQLRLDSSDEDTLSPKNGGDRL